MIAWRRTRLRTSPLTNSAPRPEVVRRGGKSSPDDFKAQCFLWCPKHSRLWAIILCKSFIRGFLATNSWNLMRKVRQSILREEVQGLFIVLWSHDRHWVIMVMRATHDNVSIFSRLLLSISGGFALLHPLARFSFLIFFLLQSSNNKEVWTKDVISQLNLSANYWICNRQSNPSQCLLKDSHPLSFLGRWVMWVFDLSITWNVLT